MLLDTYIENYFDFLGLMNRIHKTAIIGKNVRIGKNNIIEAGAIIGDNVVIGDNNYIGAYSIIGDIPESEKYLEKHTGKVVIGNNNRFTKKVTIDGGTIEATVINDNVLILVNAHVGHDAVINNRVRLSCNTIVGGWCQLGERAILGLGAIVHQRVVVPADCYISMGAVVVKKTELDSGWIYAGVPAKKLKTFTPR